MIQTIKLQELQIPENRRLFGAGATTHVLAWSETVPNYAGWSRCLHPAVKPSFTRDYRQGRIHIHTCWSGVQDPRVQTWSGFDVALAYTTLHVPPTAPERYYVCQNLTVRPHRTLLIDLLNQRDLLRRGRVSYGYRSEPQPGNNGRNTPPRHWGNLVESAWIEEETDAYQLPSPVDIPPPPVRVWSNTAFNIITETHHDDQTKAGVLWTEKTWQVIWLRRPFVICGQPGANTQLLDRGYRLLEGVDDWTWDLEKDQYRRVRALVHCVHRLCNRYTPAELHEMNRPVVEHNRRHLIESFLSEGLPEIVWESTRTDTPGAAEVCEYLQRVYDAIRGEL